MAERPANGNRQPGGGRSMGNGFHQGWLGARLDRRGAVQVRLDRRSAGTEARAVDLQILHYTLDVVARLGERDALAPVDRLDLGTALSAMLRHPLHDPAAAGIVTGKRHDVRAAVLLEQG